MDGQTDNDPIFAEDRTYAEGTIPPIRRFKFVSPGSFATMGNPLLSGRDFTWTDIHNLRPVVLVSENFAREFWQSPANALGKRIRENPKGAWREIIGVVGNEHDNGVDEKAPTMVYWPLLVKDFWFPGVVARRDVAIAYGATGRVRPLAKQAQAAVWSVNPDMPIADVGTVQDIYDKSLARTSFTLVILAIAAAMAMLLGLIGIYGVISYSVSQRTREIGIRMALGSPREKVTRMFVSHGLRLTGIGVGSGLIAALALTRLMKSLLYDVSAWIRSLTSRSPSRLSQPPHSPATCRPRARRASTR